MDRTTYHDQTDLQNTLKLREVLQTLPVFSRDYFRAMDATTTTKTRILMPMISVFSFSF